MDAVGGRRLAGRLTAVLALMVASAAPSAAAVDGAEAASGVRHTTTYEVTSDGPVRGDLAAFERRVAEILSDPRGWALDGAVAFERSDEPEFTIVLAAPRAVARADDGCSTTYSCRVGDRVLINDRNWRGMTSAWRTAGGDLSTYRDYLINHEVGHVLGFGHVGCNARGEPAAVMQQQSMALEGCVPSGWPTPDERRELARSIGAPDEVAQLGRVQHDGIPTPAEQRLRRAVTLRLVGAHAERLTTPLLGWAAEAVALLRGERPPVGPWRPATEPELDRGRDERPTTEAELARSRAEGPDRMSDQRSWARP